VTDAVSIRKRRYWSRTGVISNAGSRPILTARS